MSQRTQRKAEGTETFFPRTSASLGVSRWGVKWLNPRPTELGRAQTPESVLQRASRAKDKDEFKSVENGASGAAASGLG
jgi:hypothetical protein